MYSSILLLDIVLSYDSHEVVTYSSIQHSFHDIVWISEIGSFLVSHRKWPIKKCEYSFKIIWLFCLVESELNLSLYFLHMQFCILGSMS